jgi:hypothetical protein
MASTNNQVCEFATVVFPNCPTRGVPGSQWLAPTIGQLELAKWLTREIGAEKADWVIACPRVSSGDT